MPGKLALATVMAALAASLLVASALAGGSASSARGGTLRVNHTSSDYEYVDPQKCYDTGCSEILWPTMYNLMQYPEKNGAEGKRVYPEAATGQPVVSRTGRRTRSPSAPATRRPTARRSRRNGSSTPSSAC